MKMGCIFRIFGLCVLIFLGLINSASAELKKEISTCSLMEGALERLDCYDQVAKSNGLTEKIEKSISKDSGKWEVTTETNPVDDSKTVTLALEAESGSSRFGKPIYLVIRCKSNKTNLFIAWQDYLGSETVVLSRIGKEKARTSEWSLSTNNSSSFYPGSAPSFIRKLLASNTFVAQTTPYNENQVTAVFDTTGLDKAIVPVGETCNWNPFPKSPEAKKIDSDEESAKMDRLFKGVEIACSNSSLEGMTKSECLGYAGECQELQEKNNWPYGQTYICLKDRLNKKGGFTMSAILNAFDN